jgi:hypothetical protein
MARPNPMYWLFLFSLLFFTACEEEFIPEPIAGSEQLVVEGYNEAGDNPTPPYVIISRSFPFFSELSADQLSESFVRDAEVTVSDGERSVALSLVCLSDLPPEFRQQVGNVLGINTDSLGFNFCAYVDVSFSMMGEVGKTYDLEIKVGEEVLTASTTIPTLVELDSLWFEQPPGQPSEVYAQLYVQLNDPGDEANFYRYYTQEGDEPLSAPFGSVTDDRIFNGQGFEFPLPKAENFADGEFDQESFGLFTQGETATIKWMCIDEGHYNFWNTLEAAVSNQGPFSGYTRVSHMINGGLGVWGGIAARYYSLPVEIE